MVKIKKAVDYWVPNSNGNMCSTIPTPLGSIAEKGKRDCKGQRTRMSVMRQSSMYDRESVSMKSQEYGCKTIL